MSERNDEIAQTLMRIGKALLLYLVIGGLLIGLIFWLTGDFQNASLSLRAQFVDADDAEASVMAILDQARLHLINWTVTSLALSFICAGLFLSIAQRRRPRNSIEGASRAPVWIALLLLTLGLSGVFWWQFVSLADVAAALVTRSYVVLLIGIGLGTALAYYLSTAIAVTLTMKPSVPMGSLLPNFWN